MFARGKSRICPYNLRVLNAFLERLPDMAARNQTGMRSSDFTLERMQTLLGALGSPEQGLPGIHIAGTHGKGSVASLCAAALQAAGYRVGLFTSPHAQGALAGIQLNGAPAALEALETSFAAMQAALARREDWTHFEVVTALAFTHFARAGVDVAVIEAGLGGRLDATNVWTPSVSVITPVDYDHTSILGSQLAQIAAEKAGIIKPGVPLALAGQAPEAGEVIRRTAEQRQARVLEVGTELLFEIESFDLNGQRLRVWLAPEPRRALKLRIRLLGRHQAANAATACAALHLLDTTRLPVSDEAIQDGFAKARWPGRFELLPGEPPVLLDAAHSPGAAQALHQALQEYFPGQRFVLVLGVSADKDLQGLMAPLGGQLAGIVATQSRHPRAMPAGELAARLQEIGMPVQGSHPNAREAFGLALGLAEGWPGMPQPAPLVLVCGSVFLVEEIRRLHMPITHNRIRPNRS